MLSLLLLSAAITVGPAGGVKAFEQARDQLRASHKPNVIVLQPGDYFVDHTIELDARDPAGSTYRAMPGVRWIGGTRLREWKPVQDPAVPKPRLAAWLKCRLESWLPRRRPTPT